MLSGTAQEQDCGSPKKLPSVSDRADPERHAGHQAGSCATLAAARARPFDINPPSTAAEGQIEVFGIGARNEEVDLHEQVLPASFLKNMIKTCHGAQAIATSFQTAVQAIAADHGRLPKKVTYHAPCPGLCRKAKLFAFVTKLRRNLASIVSQLGGAESCSDATKLFALESLKDGAVRSIQVVLLVVATSTPALQCFLKCEFSGSAPSFEAWDPAEYGGREITFGRLAHVPNDTAPAAFQSDTGMLDLVLSTDLSVSIAAAEVDNIAIRQLCYTPTSLTRMLLTGVIGDPVSVEAPAAKVKTRAKRSKSNAAAQPGLDWLSILEIVDIGSNEGESDHGDDAKDDELGLGVTDEDEANGQQHDDDDDDDDDADDDDQSDCDAKTDKAFDEVFV